MFFCQLAARAQSSPPLLNIYDGFEMPTLMTNIWMSALLTPGSYEVQSEIVRAGHGALRITLRPHDVFMKGVNGDSDSERAELAESREPITREGRPYEFSWSMYLPPDFPIVPVRLVVAQWWEYCPVKDKLPCFNNSPVLAVRYIDGVLRITQDLNHRFIVLYEEKRDLRGRWLDLRFQVRFTPGASGFVKAWLDGKQVVDYTGATANVANSATGYPSPNLFQFRMGLYRNVMAQPMTIYLDEYRKRQMKDDEVAPPDKGSTAPVQ